MGKIGSSRVCKVGLAFHTVCTQMRGNHIVYEEKGFERRKGSRDDQCEDKKSRVWNKRSRGDGRGLLCITEWRHGQLVSIQYRTRPKPKVKVKVGFGGWRFKQKQEPDGTVAFSSWPEGGGEETRDEGWPREERQFRTGSRGRGESVGPGVERPSRGQNNGRQSASDW